MGDLTRPAGRATPEWLPLVVAVTLVQAVLALMSRALPIFGMPLTLAAGVPPEAVGQLSSVTSLGSMLFFLWGPALLAGMAPLRQLQLGCVLAGGAMLLTGLGRWEALLLCAFLIGLGYGPSAPAGSDLLMKVVPRHRRATIFSIKQAGVPLGGLAAGLLLPLVAVLTGSVGAGLAIAAALAVLAAVVLGRFRGLDAEAPVARAPIPWRSLLVAPVRLFALVLGRPTLAGMTAAGFALGIAQGILMGYYPVILSDHAGWSIVGAGVAFAVLQGIGVPGRVLMGWLSDRMGAPVRALSLLCLVSGATMIALATIGPNSGTVWVIALSALAGLTVVSWNGVFLSGLAEAAPEGRVGEITAAGTFVLFSGYVVAPLAIQRVFAASDGYSGGLVLAGIIPILAGLALFAGPARRPAPRP
ncbi:Sugar phosphate permease [Gemmobacter megaterium]|uniref:Sugar phosphate permease n=1 Tax=Gemmobacter megaterium TaxID=1086013 RepID=A0A1N7QQB8_9RHOB|nr:MFS transporter [Gemmobacter megaterium]GGE28722.1 MFS transporter [Gemmobacter megaterium]SIT25063.1 Sugar phosphate permease [Gemmobacter megaterium]